jgi:hypothetical protein
MKLVDQWIVSLKRVHGQLGAKCRSFRGLERGKPKKHFEEILIEKKARLRANTGPNIKGGSFA